MARVVVAIMAKAPWPGEVKTRLCPPLSAMEAAELYRSFLLDKIDQVRSLRGVSPAIAYTPTEERVLFEELAPDFLLVPQLGPDLGARLANSFAYFFAEGYAGALAIDSDTPTLPMAFLRHAVRLVTDPEIDLVLGPSEDGGYYLIGLREAHAELFEEIAWSTPRVLPETIRRAEAQKLRIARLPLWYDVDTAEDLERLKASLARADGNGPRHTRRYLLEHVR